VATYLAAESGPGAIGLQFMSLDSKATGEESLTPDSETTDAALFFLQEWHHESLRIEGGARAEHREINASGESGYSDWAFSGSLGTKYQVDDHWSLGVLFNRAERHPVSTELYALGPHAATRQFEIGEHSLGVESANGLDFSIHHESNWVSASLTAFHTKFSNFIYAAPTDEEREGFPVFHYTQADITFRGLEAELTWHAWHEGKAYLDFGLSFDRVDTEIKDSTENLPRIPPYRAGASVHFGSDLWMASSSLRHSFEQEDTAPFETTTAAYTNWSASILFDLPIQKGDWHLLVSGENLLDEEIRPHTSPIKDVAPAPGRHLRVNVSVKF
jgi:iron complex outermembrane receptor protein